MKPHWFVGLIGLLGACGNVVESAAVEQALLPESPCPPFRCANSAEVILYGMHELHLFGERNAQGVYLESFPGDPNGQAAIFFNGAPRLLAVEKGQMYARKPSGVWVTGQNLVGGELHLMQDKKQLINIKIERVNDNVTFPVGDPDPIEVYELSWYIPGSYPKIAGKNICNGATARALLDSDIYELLGMDKDETLLFTGDRVDPERMTMEPDETHGWINFGCAGFTLAKMHLTRHTSSSTMDERPDKEANQAMLKAFTGDYCGVGKPITISGTPMVWQSKKVEYFMAPDTLEARWSASGAVCLKKMRLEVNPSPEIPDPRQKLMDICSIPECGDDNPYDLGNGLRVTGNI